MIDSLIAAATLAEVGNEFRNIICNIICIIWYVIGAIAALSLLILGVKYISTESLGERENVRRNIIYVFIGLIIVIIAPLAANYLSGGLGILPLSCGCLPTPETTTTTTLPITTTMITTSSTTTVTSSTTTITTTTITSTSLPLTTTTILTKIKVLIYPTSNRGDCSKAKNSIEMLSPYNLVDLKVRSSAGEIGSSINLSKYDQVWLIDPCFTNIPLTNSEVNELLSFREKGGDLLLSVDNGVPDCVSGVNPVANRLGVNFYGSFNTGAACLNPTFSSHPLGSGITTLSSSTTDAYMDISNPNVVVVATLLGENYIAVLGEAGKGRVVFDTSSVRFCYPGCPTSQDQKYHTNIFAWLHG